jgi:D-sedoheptulose 7-phosphate isomerase
VPRLSGTPPRVTYLRVQQTLDKSINAATALLPLLRQLAPDLRRLGDAMKAAWSAGGKVLTAGKGGSAADAIHLAEELSVRYGKNRRALAALALCDPGVLTCCANDLGWDQVFSRQVEALGRPGDVLVVFSTSGKSANILRALQAGRQAGLVTAGFLGKGGGPARALCDIALVVPSNDTPRIQEASVLLYHSLCEWIEADLPEQHPA